jgi:hypothetical protein
VPQACYLRLEETLQRMQSFFGSRASEIAHKTTMNALNRALRDGVLVLCLTAAVVSPAAASKTEKIDELVGLHDLKTAVAIGNHYLKQRTLITVREELTRLGKDENLGPDWNPSNPYWKQAEGAMVRAAMKRVQHQFSNLEWLSEEWTQLDEREFTSAEVDLLLAHFKTPYGRKQLMLVDHGVALHVQGALTFTDKMVYEVPGAEEERSRMQTVFNDEDRDMRYNIDDSPEGTRFVMSPLGRRYFVNAMLNVAGMISRRIDETAASIPQTVKALSDQALPAVQAFVRSRPEG